MYLKKMFFLTVLSLWSIIAIGQDRAVIDKIVATVGNELVLLSDVEEQFDLLKKQRGESVKDDFRCSILENQLAEKLLLNQAKLDSVEVSDEEVEAQLQARFDRILAYMNNDLQQFEDYYGQTVDEVRDAFRDDQRNQILVQRMRGLIVSDISVTPSEVKTFFASIPVDSLPYFSSEVEISEIIYYPEVNEEQRNIARSKLEDLRRRIVEGGEDFAELASIYSDDLGSARIGGDLGMQRRGTFVSEFEAAAYNLEKDEISDLVETEFGFHLIQLIDRRGNNIHTRHILVKPIITQDDIELGRSKLDTVRMYVQSDSITFSRAVKIYSDENAPSYNNDGSMINPNTGSPIFETGDLDPEIYFAIDTMDIGEVSAPIQFTDRTGVVAFRVILLKSRTSPHKANLREDYSKIKSAAIEKKTNEYVAEWVKSKINSTFIEIDTRYHGCPQLETWLAEEIRP